LNILARIGLVNENLIPFHRICEESIAEIFEDLGPTGLPLTLHGCQSPAKRSGLTVTPTLVATNEKIKQKN